MALTTLEDAFVTELRELLDAEKKIAKALPGIARKADHPDLKEAIEEHHRQTREQASRLERVFEILGKKARGKKCRAVDGLIEEGKEVMNLDAEPHVMDAMLIAAVQKVEHLEIASYGTACTWAEELNCDRNAVDLLKESFSEEKETDRKLTRLAEESINAQAVG